MSQTLVRLPTFYPLQLDFFQSGQLENSVDGWVHHKTVPYSIAAQACEGSYEVQCQDGHEVLESGRVFFVPANAPVTITHRNGRSGKMRARWIHFRFSFFGSTDFLSLYETPLLLPERHGTEIGKVIRRALAEPRDRRSSPGRLVTDFQLAGRALEWICNASTIKPGVDDSILKQRLRPVLQHIRENLGSNLSVELLSRVIGLSPVQFHAVFKREVGEAPMSYIRRMRLETAVRLMAAGDAKLSLIAETVGYADPFHFSHGFKSHYGISPREYRKRLRDWNGEPPEAG